MSSVQFQMNNKLHFRSNISNISGSFFFFFNFILVKLSDIETNIFMDDRHLVLDMFIWFYFVNNHFHFSPEGFKQIECK